jgi:hypothetical protein
LCVPAFLRAFLRACVRACVRAYVRAYLSKNRFLIWREIGMAGVASHHVVRAGWAVAEAALALVPPAVHAAVATLAGVLQVAKAGSADDVKTRLRLAQVYAAYTTDLVVAARHLQAAVRVALPAHDRVGVWCVVCGGGMCLTFGVCRWR